MLRNRCRSVRNPAAATRASRRSSLAPATLTRSRRRSSCLGLIAYTAKPRSRRASTTGPCGTSMATATEPGSPATDTSQSHRAARPAPPCGNARSPTTLPAASRRQTWCLSEPQSTPANQLTVPSAMILALRDDTSRHDAGRSLYGRSKARLPTGTSYWACVMANSSGHMSHHGAQGTEWTLVAPNELARLASLHPVATRRLPRVQDGRLPLPGHDEGPTEEGKHYVRSRCHRSRQIVLSPAWGEP